MTPSRIEALRRSRPRNRLALVSVALLLGLVVYSWSAGDIALDDVFTARRAANLRRFLEVDIRPFELRGQEFDWSAHLAWARDLFLDRGLEGAVATLSMSVLAITLAALGAALLVPFAARNLAARRPFEFGAIGGSERGLAWCVLTALVRAFLVFLRAIPEYVWAFLLLAMLGASAWPAILALAIHNAGILGKLGAETVEDLDTGPLRALRAAGTSRRQIAVTAIAPAALGRFLLYFFYRFETCVREATVLGMLGVVSLGYWIQDAKSRQFYDQMVFLVALGALIVCVADLVSAFVRARIRKAGG